MSRQCIFKFPGIPSAPDILATLHLVHGVKEVLLPHYFAGSRDLADIDIKRELPFVRFIPPATMDTCLKRAELALQELELTEAKCAHYRDEYYLRVRRFFQEWFVAKCMNAQIGMLTQIDLFDAVNVLAYEYATILPPDAAKEITAWIYANTASRRSDAEFFELRHRRTDLISFLRNDVTPIISECRGRLAVSTSTQVKSRLLSDIRRLSKDASQRIKRDWPDAVSFGTSALIAIFVNPLSWINTALGGVKFGRNIVGDTRSRVNPVFSLEKVYYIDVMVPSIDRLCEGFPEFWHEARSGRLLSSTDG